MPKEILSCRIDNGIKKAIRLLSMQTSLNVSDILELSLIDFLCKFNGDLKYESVDFKLYSETIKMQRIRLLLGKQRQEFLSRELFIPRMHTDIWKLIFLKKNTKLELDKDTVKKYLELRKKEAEQYKDNEKLLSEIKFYEKELENKELDRIKTHILDQVDSENFIKKITVKNANRIKE